MHKIHIYSYSVVKCSDGNYYYHKKALCDDAKPIKFGGLDIISIIAEYPTEEEAKAVVNTLNKEVTNI